MDFRWTQLTDLCVHAFWRAFLRTNSALRVDWCPVFADGDRGRGWPGWLTRFGLRLACTGELRRRTNGTDCLIQRR